MMKMMDKIKYFLEAVSTVVRPITLPLAIKLLKNKETIPDGAKKLKDILASELQFVRHLIIQGDMDYLSP